MKLIIGLGNIGNKYKTTRHNVGFMFLDYLVKKNSVSWKEKFQSQISEISVNGEKILLAKPNTFMNKSGIAVREIVKFYKLDPNKDLYIIYDDADMEFGKLKYKEVSSSGGHNGIKSIMSHLSTNEFKRIKVGIGRNKNKSLSDFVLDDFSKKEIKELNSFIFDEIKFKLEENL